MSEYLECKICKKCKANPLHVNKAHGMSWNEYKKLTADPEFMKEVEQHRERREKEAEKEYHNSRILLYRWFPKPGKLTSLMTHYAHHAKGSKHVFKDSIYDMAEYEGKTEAIVSTVELAEAMMKNGWECVTAKGGHDGTPKQYIMRKVE